MGIKKDKNVDASKRFFLTKAITVVGWAATTAVAATGIKKAISATADSMSDNSEKYKQDDRYQAKLMSQKQLVFMTDTEKKQMVDEILNHHYKELA